VRVLARTSHVAGRRIVLLSLAVGLALSAGGSGPSPSLPPVSAPPEVVLDSYLRALVNGDCTTAGAFAVGTFTAFNGDLCGSVTVTAYRIEGNNLDGIGRRVEDASEVVYATMITTKGGGPELPDGNHTWFYSLDRQPDGSWRLAGGGTGP